MATDNHPASGAMQRAATGPPAGRRVRPGRHDRGRVRVRLGTVVRSLLLAGSVFALAALTGALLSGAAPALPAERIGGAGPGPGSAAAPSPDPAVSDAFAHSMIYTGSAGLVVSISGLVMVGRRRRLW